MWLLNLSLPNNATNLAIDEAVLLQAERDPTFGDVLRFWEFAEPCVVVGRGGQVAAEVNLDVCAATRVSVLRRSSGGGTVVGGPGCLMVSLVLNRREHSGLNSASEAIRYVLGQALNALHKLGHVARMAGTSDLCLPGNMKFSGNSLRIRPTHVLFHGTILYDFDVSLITKLLLDPPRQPEYRNQRPHAAFVANLPESPVALRAAICDVWQAHKPMDHWPKELTEQLVSEKYSRAEWNLRH